jgi:NAD-dependent deacetylase
MSTLRDGLVVLTGAGISAESGLPTFRASDGLWEGHRVEDVATPDAFARHPEVVHKFYNQRRAALDAVKPNAAHEVLVRLEKDWPGEFLLVTQNVDDLHDRAGSEQLIHMHGELRRALCVFCRGSARWAGDMNPDSACVRCGRAGGVRPDIVWFGEMPYHLDEIILALERCRIFIAVGTSGNVHPAAGFVRTAAAGGARTFEVNLAETVGSNGFQERRTGPATTALPALVDELLAWVRT